MGLCSPGLEEQRIGKRALFMFLSLNASGKNGINIPKYTVTNATSLRRDAHPGIKGRQYPSLDELSQYTSFCERLESMYLSINFYQSIHDPRLNKINRSHQSLRFNNYFLFGPNCLQTSFRIRFSVETKSWRGIGHFGDNDMLLELHHFSLSFLFFLSFLLFDSFLSI